MVFGKLVRSSSFSGNNGLKPRKHVFNPKYWHGFAVTQIEGNVIPKFLGTCRPVWYALENISSKVALHARSEVHRRAMASDLKCQLRHSKKSDTNSRECYGFIKK